MRIPTFYHLEAEFRKIHLYENIASLKENQEDRRDVHLYKNEIGKWSLFPCENAEENVFEDFRDNTPKQGRGRKQKDTTLKKFLLKDFPKSYSTKELSIRAFYDAFCCDYDKKDMEEVDQEEEMLEGESTSLNSILFGPPGTGKTYTTIKKAVQIAVPSFDTTQEFEKVKEEYDKLVKAGQIVFTTFHQSMSYEDFVEGIKPEIKEGNVTYEVKNGVFKTICEKAQAYSSLKEKEVLKKNPLEVLSKNVKPSSKFFKVSLGQNNTQEGNDVSAYCIEKNVIAMGYGGDYDYEQAKSDFYGFVENKGLSDNSISNIRRFIFELKQGDIVFVAKGFYKVLALGVITGDYFYDDSTACDYNHFRKVKWLTKEEFPVDLFYTKQFVQGTLYSLKKALFIQNAFEKTAITNREIYKNYVLIIDEINRGNVASIFGELITLLEPSKREGAKEAITLTLPYSKDEFSVPSNLHIIGTMNTADRSVEALDSALRRRFDFIETPPDSALIQKEGALKSANGVLKVGDENIDVKVILETINKRIEKLLDKDHLIGHSYFLQVSSLEELKAVFYKNIIPLLQEYFYGDYGKIALVIGEGFFDLQQDDNDENVFASVENLGYSTQGLASRMVFKILSIKDMGDQNFVQALNTLLLK